MQFFTRAGSSSRRMAAITYGMVLWWLLLAGLSSRRASVQASARDPSDMEDFYRKTLDLDLALWRDRRPSMAGDFHAMRLLLAQDKLGGRDKVKTVLLYNSTWVFPDNKGSVYECEEPCHPHMRDTMAKLSEAVAQGLVLPNAVFLFNSGDDSYCHPHYSPPENPCTVPMLAHIKAASDCTDLLVPQFKFLIRDLHELPWAQKEPIAFFRGTPYCSSQGFNHTCSRVYLAYASRFHNVTKAVQIGITHDYSVPQDREVMEHGPYNKMPNVPIHKHARFRWLLSLDGISASTRFGLLLHLNSVVLKQRSAKIEYFYRALEVGKHYLEFWIDSRDDVFDIVTRLNSEYDRDSARFHAMAKEAQLFAMRYLNVRARVRYWRAVLLEYRALMPDMDEYVVRVVKELKEQGRLGGTPT